MANTNIDGKSSINVARLVMWPLTSDTKEGITYGEVRTFPDELNSAKYAPKVATASQYGDGKKVEDYVAKDGGDIEVVIRGFAPGDEAFLFGEKQTKDGTSVSNSGDIVPYVACAYMIELPNGHVNLLKFPKVKWMPQGADSKQREGSSISYTTATLKGTYSPTIKSGDDKYSRLNLDPSNEADAAVIESWFTEGAFYMRGDYAPGPSETV